MSVAVNTSPSGALGNQGSWKRKGSDDEDDKRSDVKRAKYSWFVTLESESSVPTDEDEESIYTVQGYETEYARDTSDTSTHTYVTTDNSETEEDCHVEEFDIDSRSENEVLYNSLSSSSAPEEHVITVELIGFSAVNSEGYADNSDDSRSSMDSEVKKTFFRTCVQCKDKNDNPSFQFCEKCYQLRKSVYPRDRPRRKPRAPKEAKIKRPRPMPTNSSQELCEMDSGISSQPTSQCSSQEFVDSQGSDLLASFESPRTATSVLRTKVSTIATSTSLSSQTSITSVESNENDSGTASKECDSDLSSTDSDQGLSAVDLSKESSSKISSQPSSQDSKSLDAVCNMCITKTVSGIFSHGKSAHLYGCYDCAKKTFRMNGNRCPVCNRKSSKPTKLFR